MSNGGEAALFRLRVAYPKLGRLRYLGHLELIHTVEQIVRRAQLPYAVTRGFSPHMRIAYTSALPVGTSSCTEYFDVHLTAFIRPGEALARLQAASPPDLRPFAAAYVDLRRAALTAEITRIDYLVRLVFAPGAPVSGEDVDRLISSWVECGAEIPYRRGKKEKTLIPSRVLEGYEMRIDAGGHIWLELRTRCDNDGSLRPEILIAALDQGLRGLAPGVDEPIISVGNQQLIHIAAYDIERTAQRIRLDDGTQTHPLDLPSARAPRGLAVRAPL